MKLKQRIADWVLGVAKKYATPVEQPENTVPEMKKEPLWFPKGTKIIFKCSYCRRGVHKTIENENNDPGVFCSDKCRKLNNKRSQAFRRNPSKCPTPGKVGYDVSETAHRDLTLLRREKPDYRWTRVYTCQCGKYHLGRWKYEIASLGTG